MPIRLPHLLLATCIAGVAPLAAADVLTFEDLTGDGFQPFVADYHGFRFGTNDANTTAWLYSNQPVVDITTGNVFYGPSSGRYYAATDFSLYDGTNPAQAAQPITNANAFTFQGAYFSGSDQIQYQLYGSAGNLLFTSTPSAALGSTPIFVASGYAGLVNSVVIVGRQGYYGMDDFTYTMTAPVPEPATWALLVLGLAGVAGTVRRRCLADAR